MTETRSIQISNVAHIKMLFHALKYPTSSIHGILIGYPSSSSSSQKKKLVIEDALPVCHSPPTKPLLDMAFRLTDVYCHSYDKTNCEMNKEHYDEKPDCRIVGWYTANERLDDEQPNPVSLRIVSSIAATTATNHHRLHSDSSSSATTTSTMEPVLMVINNKELGVLIHPQTEDDKANKSYSNAALRIYGKDIKTKHWSNLLFPPHSANEEEETPILFHSDDTTPTTIPNMIQSKKDDIVYGIMPFYDFEDHLESSSDRKEFKDWMVNIAVDDFVHSFTESVGR